ncbi:MAG: hypothetical protein JNK16_15320 [Phycisphaerales bacterium]|nr:hypothetical protein [Phycisphaerales bacterium]
MTSFNAPAERDINWGPERTSIVAIIALVFALPCFIPGFGIIASLLAVFALVGIAGSKGRVGGTGLAIAALVIGLFGTALWTALGYGAWQAMSFFDKQIVGSTAIVMTEIKDGEWDKAKGRFVPASADKLTPEMFEAFRTGYREKFGEFEGAPSGLMDIIDGYSKLGPLMGNLKNPPQNTLPLPLRFANGPALLMLEFDPSPHAKSSNPPTGQPSVKAFPIRNLTVLGQNGAVVTLIDPTLLPSSSVIELKPGAAIKVKGLPEPSAPEGGNKPEAPEPAKVPAPAPSQPKQPS